MMWLLFGRHLLVVQYGFCAVPRCSDSSECVHLSPAGGIGSPTLWRGLPRVCDVLIARVFRGAARHSHSEGTLSLGAAPSFLYTNHVYSTALAHSFPAGTDAQSGTIFFPTYTEMHAPRLALNAGFANLDPQRGRHEFPEQWSGFWWCSPLFLGKHSRGRGSFHPDARFLVDRTAARVALFEDTNVR